MRVRVCGGGLNEGVCEYQEVLQGEEKMFDPIFFRSIKEKWNTIFFILRSLQFLHFLLLSLFLHHIHTHTHSQLHAHKHTPTPMHCHAHTLSPSFQFIPQDSVKECESASKKVLLTFGGGISKDFGIFWKWVEIER